MKLDRILKRVEKPTRYIGGEINSVVKDHNKVAVKYLHAFPDVYEVGISHIGSQILYGVVNDHPDLACERVYAVWEDMEEQLISNNIPIFSLETKTPLTDFDVVGFTLQYEMSYTNILNMLKLGGVEPAKAKRENAPLILAGGPCAYNPEPLVDVVDLFLLGEGENQLPHFLEYYRDYYHRLDRREFLIGATAIQGVYVPELYDVEYNDDGTIKSFTPNDIRVPKRVVKQHIPNMDDVYYPNNMIVPFGDAVHNRAVVEIFRGCTAGCRFCQAGMIYRPVREKSKEKVVETVEKVLAETGYEEVSLMSLSTLDHSEIEEIISTLIARQEEEKVGVSLPSLRLDSFSIDVLTEIQKVRKTGLTFAPEAGTQRMRDVINKGVTDEDINETMRDVFTKGWDRVKLYFMLGLPTETREDVDGIREIARRLAYMYKQITTGQKRKGLSITVSTSVFVPKPFTPFQWFGQVDSETVTAHQAYLVDALRKGPISYKYHDMGTSHIEAVFARGDRKLGKALLLASERGFKFDGWDQYFDYQKWLDVFADTGIDVEFYANRERPFDEILPWDFIDIGVDKAYLKREWDRAVEAKTTKDCRKGCVKCGINTGAVAGLCG